jgi:hypothetical protein
MPDDLPNAYANRIVSLAKVASVPARAIDDPQVVRDFRAVCEQMGILAKENDTIRPN